MDRYEYALSGLQHPQLQLCINAQRLMGHRLQVAVCGLKIPAQHFPQSLSLHN